MKVTVYAPPFRPPFFRSLGNLYSFDPYILAKMRKMYFNPYILAKMRKMSYFDHYFSSKLGKMYSFDPLFLSLLSMKVTIYAICAPPFRPSFFRSLEYLYSFDPYILSKMRKMYFDPYILSKMRKMSHFDPYFSSKLGKMYSFDPLFFTLVAFRVDGWWGAFLSESWPSTRGWVMVARPTNSPRPRVVDVESRKPVSGGKWRHFNGDSLTRAFPVVDNLRSWTVELTVQTWASLHRGQWQFIFFLIS